MARDLIARSLAAGGHDREKLRTRARIYAGYADHFLQDSYAAGHLVNKTLVMQWYVEWLADARIPCLDRHVRARMTTSRQPFLHGPDHYDRIAAGPGVPALPPWDPQGVVEAPTLKARIEASGVVGSSDQERRDAYAAYLAMLGSTVAQLAASLLHGYFNKRSLVVAAGPDGTPFRMHGDRTLLAGGDGALHAARATAASRRAVAELLAHGETGSPARRSSRAFRTTSNRRARSSPCASGMTAACATCVSASCSACGGPARRESSRRPSAAGWACPHRTSRPCGTGNPLAHYR